MNDLKLFYSTDEVAEHFGVAASKIRYYEREFGLKIKVNGKNRAFTKADIVVIGEIIALIDEENYTIAGAKEQLKSRKQKKSTAQEVVKKLKNIREILVRLKG